VKTDKKGGNGQLVRWKVWWRQSNIKCAVSEEYDLCWVHQDCHVEDEQKSALKKEARVSGEKDKCQVRLKGRERDYWMGIEIGMLGGYEFQGQVRAGDGSDTKGKIGAGYNNLRRKKTKSCSAKWDERKRAPAQIGLNWQHSLALRDTLIEEPLLYLRDNQSEHC